MRQHSSKKKSNSLVVRSCLIKLMLQWAIFPSTCLAILLRQKLHEKLPSVLPQTFHATVWLPPPLKMPLFRSAQLLISVTSSLQLLSQRHLASPNKTTPFRTCDRRRRGKLQETLPSATRFKQLVSHHTISLAARMLEKLHKKLPSVT